jgi:hypothetical protein
MPLPKDKAWFPAKTYGYGWGLPRRWQGGLVFFLYLGALIAGTGIIRKGAGYFVLYALALSLVLAGICWWKGEESHWRWGPDR